MQGTLAQRKVVARKLRDYLEEVEWIKTKVESLSTLSKDDKSEVTERFGKLKDKLEGEYRNMELVKNQLSLNPAEAAFYLPAVQNAYLKLTAIRRRTRPSLKWFDALYLAIHELQYYMPSIEREGLPK